MKRDIPSPSLHARVWSSTSNTNFKFFLTMSNALFQDAALYLMIFLSCVTPSRETLAPKSLTRCRFFVWLLRDVASGARCPFLWFTCSRLVDPLSQKSEVLTDDVKRVVSKHCIVFGDISLNIMPDLELHKSPFRRITTTSGYTTLHA